MKTVGLVKFVNVCYALVEEWGHGEGCSTKLRKIKKNDHGYYYTMHGQNIYIPSDMECVTVKEMEM